MTDADHKVEHAISLLRVVARVVVPENPAAFGIAAHVLHRGRADVESDNHWVAHLNLVSPDVRLRQFELNVTSCTRFTPWTSTHSRDDAQMTLRGRGHWRRFEAVCLAGAAGLPIRH